MTQYMGLFDLTEYFSHISAQLFKNQLEARGKLPFTFSGIAKLISYNTRSYDK